ncbi:AER378Wp [Eremothecium gossypii ATCC 10895]|uniref:AER378Wp n=1 Tax=Eremothecium gossypii (strain ATCC 10895 / CBS 109.51 / FGSC 9923 / NRRL Y-1056) TaxID=284811 RepID=Q755Y9_EREGS|nr:AER378Wp [Eremothecium gossypii ATCC 10895]AAS53058.2 AER378Wp [Eremothecium gossypii ATCC 10895]AEY97366.1 FAER378Wp [Eremothecium gossypii FDAG1]
MNTGFTFPAASSDTADKGAAEQQHGFRFPVTEEGKLPAEGLKIDIPSAFGGEGAEEEVAEPGTPLEEAEDPVAVVPVAPYEDYVEPPTKSAHMHQLSDPVPTEPSSATSNRSFGHEYAMHMRHKLATDWKSPSEYALHILFTKFVRHAETKLNMCLQPPLEFEPVIVDILGEGVDPTFDKIISSLGYISRKNPKPVIGAMMFWRKTKSEVAAVAAENVEKLLREYDQYQQETHGTVDQPTPPLTFPKSTAQGASSGQRLSHKRNNSTKSSKSSRSSNTICIDPKLRSLDQQIEVAKELAFQADRKSLISIYILCSVLIEIVKQVPDDADSDLSDKLEEIVFTQLKTTDPMSISSSIIKSSNWNAFAELLGCMSERKFISVSDRFIADLENIPSMVSREMESSIHLLILGMRYLKLRNYPLEAFEESADFIKSIAKFFSRSQNFSIKLAYAEVITQLLLPLVGSVTAEVNHPTWVEAMTTILATCKKLMADSRYWASSFMLTVAVLCVSPHELFAQNWMTLVEKNISKIKSKNLNDLIIFAVGLSRLVWVYLFRCTETLNNTERTLKQLLASFLSNKKKDLWITADMDLINPLCDVLVTIAYLYPSFILETFLIPLVKMSFNGNSLDNLNYEKLLLAINAYRGILLTKERPEFPENESRFYEVSLNNISFPTNADIMADHEELWKYFYSLFLLLDSSIGSEVWSPENDHHRQASTPFSGISSFSFSFGNDNNSNSNKHMNVAIFATLIETIPCCLCVSSSLPFKSTIEILARNAVHGDLLIATSARNSLKALASKTNPYTLITWFAKYSFDFDEKTQSRYTLAYLSSSEYENLLVLYVELLECWLESFKAANNEKKQQETGLDGIELPFKDTDPSDASENEKIEWKNIATVIEDVEGNGLFFLCSHDPAVRRLALQILKITSNFDEVILEKTGRFERQHSRTKSTFVAERGTRLIDLLQTLNVVKLLEPEKGYLSAAEKARLNKLNNKLKNGTLIKICTSEYGVDAALWQRVFPKLLSTIFISSPVTMALCRSIVCIRLVQIHEIILSIVNNSSTKSTEFVPETVNQWKLYLIVACTSLTSTNDQKLHIPSSDRSHGRNKSQQIFTVQHQKIKSATSVFKMVLPLLNCKQSFIRDAIIIGLSSMNVNIYKAYIQSIERPLVSWKLDDNKNLMRVEMMHVLVILSPFLEHSLIANDEWILRKLSLLLKETKQFLESKQVQTSFTYQSLRRYFAGFVASFFNAVKHHALRDELFPFEARASCFNFLREWCGHGQYSEISKERYAIMFQQEEKNRTLFAAAMEFQRSKLESVSLESMIILCSDTITKVINDGDNSIQISFDTTGLLYWIDSLLNSDTEKVRLLGVRALKKLLENNMDNKRLYSDVLAQCAIPTDDAVVRTYYYNTLCECLLQMNDINLPEDDLIALGLYGIISDRKEMRSNAIDVLSLVETAIHNSSYAKVFKERLANESKTVYKSTAKEISNVFAELPSQEMRLQLFSKMAKRFSVLSSELKQDILILLLPWVHKFVLKSFDDVDTYMVLTNLVAMTIEANSRYPMEIEQLWISLGKGNAFQNIHVALDYIMATSVAYCNPEYVRRAMDIVLYLANVPGGIGVVDNLMKNLKPKHMVPNRKSNPTFPELGERYVFVAHIPKLLKFNGKDVMFSKAQLSVIFLVNLLTIPNEALESKLPLLLHICVSFLDHYVPIIQESASKLLCDLIYGLAPTHPKSAETVQLIKSRNGLWSYDNFLKDKSAVRSPKQMDYLIRNIVDIFSHVDSLAINWQRTALKWATSCAVRHIACRSFQVFRSLLIFLDQEMLRDMLHRLSNTLADENADIQGFAMQILMTLNAITVELDALKLIDFPQLFWCVVACLGSVHEQEYIESLNTLSVFVSKIDLDSPDTVQCLTAIFPSNWEGKFEGLQKIILTGLRSSDSWEISLDLLDRLNLLYDCQITAEPDTRLLFALLANLPRFLQAMDTKKFGGKIKTACSSIISLANASDQPSLARLVDSLQKNKFRSKKDFMSQIVSFISRNYFPNYSADTLVFLLGLLFNKIGWIKVQTMEILKFIFPLVDLTRPEFTGVGADLISPLLKLLLTEYELQALEVLNSVQNVSGSKLDKEVLRISMGNKDAKNFYAKTATLFGIPDESGWSIPMPSVAAATTRHNVHAVFTTCSVPVYGEPADPEAEKLDDILEFHADGGYGQYSGEVTDNISVAEEKEATLSLMWAELDNLDSFFTKEAAAVPESDLESLDSKNPQHTPSNSMDTATLENIGGLEATHRLYDKKVSKILNRTLTRTPSNLSFKANLADSFGNNLNDGLSSTGNMRSTYRTSIYGSRHDMIPQTLKSPQSTRSPTHGMLGHMSPSRTRVPDSPQESLFRFEGLLRNPHKNKKKWLQQQQQQQLLAQTIQEQVPY